MESNFDVSKPPRKIVYCSECPKVDYPDHDTDFQIQVARRDAIARHEGCKDYKTCEHSILIRTPIKEKACDLGCDPCACLAPILHGVISGEMEVQRYNKKNHWAEPEFAVRDLKFHCKIHNKHIGLQDNGSGYYYHP
jgi:hypothetical protein